MTFSHATTAAAGILCKMGVEYLVRENGVNATLVPKERQARASGENLNYVTLAP